MTPEQINMLQSRIERIENELGLKHPDYFAMPLKSNLSEKPNSCDHYIPQPGEAKDYTHLLPDGYEFCMEEQAEDWVKVELYETQKKQAQVGFTWEPNSREIDFNYKPYYRPIRKIQYHVQVHEAVTAEPNPYAVDWANAPEWADVHAYDKNEIGVFYGVEQGDSQYKPKWTASGLLLPAGLDWKQSKTVRP